MQFIYSYDLASLKELWAHLDQRMFSKLEHSFTPCKYYQLFSFYYILIKLYYLVMSAIKSFSLLRIPDFSDCCVSVTFDSCPQAGKCCTEILSG
jgi:hypothetical protein